MLKLSSGQHVMYAGEAAAYLDIAPCTLRVLVRQGKIERTAPELWPGPRMPLYLRGSVEAYKTGRRHNSRWHE
jgi:hypothetical protein